MALLGSNTPDSELTSEGSCGTLHHQQTEQQMFDLHIRHYQFELYARYCYAAYAARHGG